MSSLSSSPPSALTGLILSRDQRKAAGVGEGYFDTYNSAISQDYMRDLAEYMYNKYQSPAAMARQYEEAGLNRNFASQSGGNIDVPSNSFRSNISESQGRIVNQNLQAFNSILGLIRTGVDSVSQITNLPKDLAIKEYEKAIAQYNSLTAKGKADEQSWKVTSAMAKGLYDAAYYGGANIDASKFSAGEGIELSSEGFANSPAINQANLRNALMDLKVKTAGWDLNNLKPAQLSQINEMIDNIAVRTDFLGVQKDMYSSLKAAGVLAPIIVSLLKLIAL